MRNLKPVKLKYLSKKITVFRASIQYCVLNRVCMHNRMIKKLKCLLIAIVKYYFNAPIMTVHNQLLMLQMHIVFQCFNLFYVIFRIKFHNPIYRRLT